MKLFDGDDLGGPFDLIAGLPLHPLASHAPVVLVPLVAFAALAMSYWPSFSRKAGFNSSCPCCNLGSGLYLFNWPLRSRIGLGLAS
ncbi:MAG: hypothetical protein EBV43_03985 [Actinobacteria bacterium]|nr:hypothetical protein [Actinomycetota bacterium]